MALQKQAMEIAFAAGLQERVRPEVLDPHAAFLTLSNVVQDKRGAFTKRRGVSALSTVVLRTLDASYNYFTPAPIAAGFRGGARQGVTPWVVDGHSLYERSEQDEEWSLVGQVPECVARRGPAPQPAGVIGVGREVAYCNGFLVVTTVATDASGTAIWLHVLDEKTGAKVYGPIQVATKTNPNGGTATPDAWPGQTWFHKLVVTGTNVWVIYALTTVGPGKEIHGTRLDCSSIANLIAHYNDIVLVGGGAPLAQEGAHGAGFGATGGSVSFAVAYIDTGGHLNTVLFSSAGVVQFFTGGYGTAATTTRAIDLDGLDGDTLWLAWDKPVSATASQIRVLGLSPINVAQTVNEAIVLSLTSANAVAGSAFIPTIGVKGLDAGHGMVVASAISNPGGSSFGIGRQAMQFLWRDFRTVAGTAAPNAAGTRSAPNIELYARPFVVDSKVYAVAHSGYFSDTGANNSVWVVDLDMSNFGAPGGPVRPVANIAPFLCGTTSLSYNFAFGYSAHDVAKVTDASWRFLIPVRRNALDPQGVELVEIDFDDPNLWQPVSDAQQLTLGGGVVTVDDGVRMQESSFLRPPTIFAEAVGGGTQSTLTPTASYGYAAVFEYIDSQGNLHQSEPAFVAGVTTGANPQNLQIFVSALGVSCRDSRIVAGHAPWSAYSVALYRTVGDGSTYYRLPTQTNVDLGFGSSPQRANGAGLYVSFVDSIADSAITGNQQLYTQPGVLGTPLPRRAPPSLTCVIQHSDNLIGVDETGRRLWASSERVEGEGIWWNSLTSLPIEDDSRVIALASFDGRIWALTENSIWFIDGQGFTDNGSGGYSPPVKLPVDDGCIEPRSVVVTPLGAFFQSALGIMLLSRSAEVQFVGEPVAKTLATYPVITSSVLNPAEHLVAFTCATAETSAGATAPGVVVVYDYVGQMWFTWTINGRNPAIQTAWMQIVDGAHTMAFLDTAGVVWLQSGDSLDGGAWVEMQVETGWIKTGGLQGFQRLWRMFLLFAPNTAHDLTIEFAFDYVDSYTESRTFTSTEILAMSPAELEHHFAQQKSRAVKMRITDAAPTGGEPVDSGAGSALLGLRASYGVKGKTPMAAGAR